MAKNQPKVKQKLLSELERIPIVEIACKRAGVARSTYYRWIDSDDDFREEVQQALEKGADIINDMAESKLINGIKEDKPQFVFFWLRHNHPKYRPAYLSKNKRKTMWDRQPLKALVEFIGDDGSIDDNGYKG